MDDGVAVGGADGLEVGSALGAELGVAVGDVGEEVGDTDGEEVGGEVGPCSKHIGRGNIAWVTICKKTYLLYLWMEWRLVRKWALWLAVW